MNLQRSHSDCTGQTATLLVNCLPIFRLSQVFHARWTHFWKQGNLSSSSIKYVITSACNFSNVMDEDLGGLSCIKSLSSSITQQLLMIKESTTYQLKDTSTVNLSGKELEMQLYFCVIQHNFVNKQFLPTTLIKSRRASQCLVKKRVEREKNKFDTLNSSHQIEHF